MSLQAAHALFLEMVPQLKKDNWEASDRGECENPWLRPGKHNSRCALAHLVLKGHVELVKQVLAFHQETQIDVDIQGAWFQIAAATYSKQKDLVNAFCELPIDLNWVNQSYQRTLLMQAVSFGSEGCVKALLEQGVDPNVQPKGCVKSVLSTFLSFEKDKPDMLKALLDAGMDIQNGSFPQNPHPIELLCLMGPGNTTCVLESGVDPNWVGFHGRSLLHTLLIQQSLKEDFPSLSLKTDLEPIVNTLIQHGAKINFDVNGVPASVFNRNITTPFQAIEALAMQSELQAHLPQSQVAKSVTAPRI